MSYENRIMAVVESAWKSAKASVWALKRRVLSLSAETLVTMFAAVVGAVAAVMAVWVVRSYRRSGRPVLDIESE